MSSIKNVVGWKMRMDEYSFVATTDTNSLFIENNRNVLLGGMALSLAEYDGKYALSVIIVDGTQNNYTHIFKGQLIKSCTSVYGKSFPCTIDTGSSIPENKVVWGGMPLAVNNENKLIVVEKTGDIVETKKFALGGEYYTAGRIGSKWYLLVTNVN